MAQDLAQSAKVRVLDWTERFGIYGMIRAMRQSGQPQFEDPSIAGLPPMPGNHYFDQAGDEDRGERTPGSS